MNLLVNGAPQELPPGSSVENLIMHLNLGGKRLAIERNGEIVPRSLYAQLLLQPGDKIEIVRAIGGG